MLARLKITNFLLIEQLELDFHSGLTVLTGETGSGKSIIIDALMLLFGARAPKDVIRSNQVQATFEAEFTLSNPNAIQWLQNNDLVDTDNPNGIICRRVIDRSGKNKIYINGNAVTSSQVKVLGEFVLDIHTQHASITLLKTEVQRSLLDEYAGLTVQTQQLANVYRQLSVIEQKLHTARSESRELELRRQVLVVSVDELRALGLKAGEWEELEAKHKQLANAGEVLSELDYALNLLQSQDSSVIENIGKLQLRLSKIADQFSKGEELVSLINSIEIELQELIHAITLSATKIEQDPQSLNDIELRINQVFDLARKYRVLPEQIADTLAKWQQELDSLNHDSNIEMLETELVQVKAEYMLIAKNISTRRNKSAQELSVKVTELLHKLAISGEFKVELIPQSSLSSYGMENIEYQVGFNKGMAMQSLVKAASGGELSRAALALYLLLSIHNPPEVIIFDEIDVGIGGKVAAIVGEMLSKLGEVKQVICITHQPQTAVYGDKHLIVSKHHQNEISKAQINYVEKDKRVDEIARMLGGVEVTKTTLTHATEMLQSSGKNK